jgi:outer membrane protein TolC
MSLVLQHKLFHLMVFIGLALSAHAAHASDDASNPLTLNEAEQLALSNDPLIARFDALSTALKEQSVADAQLPDPQLSVGLDDAPINDLFDENSTEIEVGLQQSFPPGDTLRHRGAQTLAYAGAEDARRAEQQRKILREVRYWWLEVYDQTEAARLVRQDQKLSAQIADITRFQYGAGYVTQQDVLSAELETNRLDDRIAELEAKRNEALAKLANWIGSELQARPLAEEWPTLSPLPTHAELAAQLDSHPLMLVEDAMLRAGQSGVELAREQYKPAWDVGLRYDARAGGRDDFLAPMVTLSLPLFTDKRQDRRLAASQSELHAARYTRDDRRRELRTLLDTEYALWKGADARLDLNEKRLAPQAEQTAEAALNAYQNNVTDLPTLIRARITALETRLEALHLRVHRAQAQAKLLYLTED